MNCRLCNEKIPRMRALFKKSEFCCDEHAEQYKDQTLDRLLSEEGQQPEAGAPLPLQREADQPLTALESRTPLLEGNTLYGGPRRLAPPEPALPLAEGQSGFGALLDRLPDKRPGLPSGATIGGWDQTGGEDPLKALLRLEGAAPSTGGEFGLAREVTPSGFDSPTAGASPGEEDAIAALRKLAEEARQSARAKPADRSTPEAAEEDPFDRFITKDWDAAKASSVEDPWSSPARLLSSPGDGPGEQPPEIPFDALDSPGADSEQGPSDGLSMFDRLVRDFHSDSDGEPEGPTRGAAAPGSEALGAKTWDEPSSDHSSDDGKGDFSGSIFDRLMDNALAPKPAATSGSSTAKVFEAYSIEAAPQAEAAVELAHSPGISRVLEIETAPPAQNHTGVPQVDGIERAEPEETVNQAADPSPGTPAPGRRTPRGPTVRKAALIVPRTELSDFAPSGWPGDAGIAGDPEFAGRIFERQRASEAAQFAPPSPRPQESSHPILAVQHASFPGASAGRERIWKIPRRSQVIDIELEGSAAPLEPPGDLERAKEFGEVRPPAPPVQTTGTPAATGASPKVLRRLPFRGRIAVIEPELPAIQPAAEVSLPAFECRPGDVPWFGPPSSAARASTWGRVDPVHMPRLEPLDAPPVPAVPELAQPPRSERAAVPPSAAVRLPGSGQYRHSNSPATSTLPSAIEDMAGAEPSGSSFDPIDLEQMRRLVADRTDTPLRGNGAVSTIWNASLVAQPFHPGLLPENGSRV